MQIKTTRSFIPLLSGKITQSLRTYWWGGCGKTHFHIHGIYRDNLSLSNKVTHTCTIDPAKPSLRSHQEDTHLYVWMSLNARSYNFVNTKYQKKPQVPEIDACISKLWLNTQGRSSQPEKERGRCLSSHLYADLQWERHGETVST